MKPHDYKFRIFTLRHLGFVGIFAGMVFIAYLIVGSGVIENWVLRGGSWWLGLAFLGGLLYTTFSTTPIAVAIFISLAGAGAPGFLVAMLGGVGAAIGDTGLLAALRIGIIDEALAYFARKTHGAFAKFMHRRLVRIVTILLGGIIVASPLPDELGIAIMGLTHLPNRYIMLVSFFFNTASIATIVYLAH